MLNNLAHSSPNVLAVTDVFAGAIKELRSNSSNRKNVAEKNRTKGVARLRFFVARAAEGGDAVTVLLGEVKILT
jgi:hypothetical protein